VPILDATRLKTLLEKRKEFVSWKSVLTFPVEGADIPGGRQLTQGDQVTVVLQHHSPVQVPLRGVQACPLLLREVDGYI